MEDLAASIHVSVVASVDPVETGEGSVGNIGEGGIVQAGLPRDLLSEVVLAADGGSEAEAEDQQRPRSSSHLFNKSGPASQCWLEEDWEETETEQPGWICFISRLLCPCDLQCRLGWKIQQNHELSSDPLPRIQNICGFVIINIFKTTNNLHNIITQSTPVTQYCIFVSISTNIFFSNSQRINKLFSMEHVKEYHYDYLFQHY